MLWSCQARAEVPAVRLSPHRLKPSDRCQYQQVVFQCSPLLPDSATEETARNGKEWCFCLQEAAWGLKRVYGLRWPSAQLSLSHHQKRPKMQILEASQPWCGEGSTSASGAWPLQRNQWCKQISLMPTPQEEQADDVKTKKCSNYKLMTKSKGWRRRSNHANDIKKGAFRFILRRDTGTMSGLFVLGERSNFIDYPLT